jgi:HK97 family phage major capsid protein
MGATEEMETINQTLGEVNRFVKDRFVPVEQKLEILEPEMARLTAAVNESQERQREVDRAALLRTSSEGLVVPDGPYAGLSPLDLRILRGIARSQLANAAGPEGSEWTQRTDAAYRSLVEAATPGVVEATLGRRLDAARSAYLSGSQFGEAAESVMGDFHRAAMRAAMDSTTAGFGDELVPTLEAQELWMDVNLQTLVANLIPTSPMPSSPFDIPLQLGDVNFFPGAENIATTSTRLATAKQTLTAYELVGQVPFSFTLEEDAVIALLPEIRAGLVRNVAQILDDLVLNADTTATNGINSDGATIAKSDAGKGHWLLGYDGLIHLPLVDNTSQSNTHGAAPTDDMFNEIRGKLGKYGTRPSELVWVMDTSTYIRAQGIAAFRTMDKLGDNATLLRGMLGAVSGIPVVASEQMLLAAADGKVTDGVAGTLGRLLIFNRTQWRQGFRRQMTIDVDRDTQKRQTVVTVSFRHALMERSGTRSTATHTGMQYNITV